MAERPAGDAPLARSGPVPPVLRRRSLRYRSPCRFERGLPDRLCGCCSGHRDGVEEVELVLGQRTRRVRSITDAICVRRNVAPLLRRPCNVVAVNRERLAPLRCVGHHQDPAYGVDLHGNAPAHGLSSPRPALRTKSLVFARRGPFWAASLCLEDCLQTGVSVARRVTPRFAPAALPPSNHLHPFVTLPP